jgi:alkylated DNA repair dioxygenase AlkB
MTTIDLADGGWLLLAEGFLAPGEAGNFFEKLMGETRWARKPGLFGHPQPRLTAAHGDAGIDYRYSGTSNPASPWTDALLEIRSRVEQVRGRYNFCLLNRYRSGADSVGWHADDEPGMGDTIASLSLGATRIFRIRHNQTRETRSFPLADGTLLIMGGSMQRFWKHSVPKTARPVGERVNLTFRWLAR